eukprot:NODE_120_length_18891_cov_0.302682.p5 type:complete len:471 gc:universal NODE_120_length_18891_cov_0.302682:3942-2530(-)
MVSASASMLYYLNVFAVIDQCQDIVNLAKGLRMDIKYPNEYDDLLFDCCLSTSITCVESNSVTEIKWGASYGFGELDGFINGTAIPDTVTYMALGKNKVGGSFPSTLPKSLTNFYLQTNLVSGNLPKLMPPNLAVFWCYSNRITGDLPIFPDSTTQIYLYQNNMNGTVPNKFPKNLQTLWLYSNYLTGDITNIPRTTTSLYLGLTSYSGNHFSGSITLQSPTAVSINYNWIADVVIYDSSRLTTCDLSFNPLLGNPNIGNLTGCTKTGLYSAAGLPITRSTSSKLTISMSYNSVASVYTSKEALSDFNTINLEDTQSIIASYKESLNFENSITVSPSYTLTSASIPIISSSSKKRSSLITSFYQYRTTIPKSSLKRSTYPEAVDTDFYESELDSKFTYQIPVFSFTVTQWINAIVRWMISSFFLNYIIRKAPLRRGWKSTLSRSFNQHSTTSKPSTGMSRTNQSADYYKQ